jgi:hypothetical protein
MLGLLLLIDILSKKLPERTGRIGGNNGIAKAGCFEVMHNPVCTVFFN